MKKKMAISFSGGRTSGFMTKWLLDNKSDEYEFVVTFANTGQEHEKTLEFVNNCDKHFGFNTVWVEAVVHYNQRKGNTHKIVTFDTASRDGEPFEAYIKKYGIPNQSCPHCTDRLKLMPMTSYLRSIGFKRGDHEVAIGIRADESRRVRKDATDAKIVYPLVDMYPVDKQDVLDWWEDQAFDLNIAEHHGNCKWCWKKSLKKHMSLITEMPEIYNFPRRMESRYPHVGQNGRDLERRTFFRGNRSTDDLFRMHSELGSTPELLGRDAYADGGCSESCELYATE